MQNFPAEKIPEVPNRFPGTLRSIRDFWHPDQDV
jgi:hypothetical protein